MLDLLQPLRQGPRFPRCVSALEGFATPALLDLLSQSLGGPAQLGGLGLKPLAPALVLDHDQPPDVLDRQRLAFWVRRSQNWSRAVWSYNSAKRAAFLAWS